MIGDYIVQIDGKDFHYTDINNIPKEFDHLIKFVPIEPPEPHTQADHDYINTFPIKFSEIFKREKK